MFCLYFFLVYNLFFYFPYGILNIDTTYIDRPPSHQIIKMSIFSFKNCICLNQMKFTFTYGLRSNFPQWPTILQHLLKNYSFPYFQKLLTWFLPRPPSFWSVSGNCFFGFLGGVLLWFFFYFSNSFSTFLTDSLLALLPPAKCYCFAMFYTRSSLFSLKIPALPPQLQETTVCQRPSLPVLQAHMRGYGERPWGHLNSKGLWSHVVGRALVHL